MAERLHVEQGEPVTHRARDDGAEVKPIVKAMVVVISGWRMVFLPFLLFYRLA